MRLYKDYKADQEQMLREERDKEAAELEENVVIIYEKKGSVFKNIFAFIFLILILFVLAAAILFLMQTVFMEV